MELGTDFFLVLGLPRRYSLDAAALEPAYLERSRALHPDYHRGGATAEQDASERQMAELNEAYTTLTDPFKRISHLLALAGGPAAGEDKTQDQAFLMEMMDYRERLEAGEDLAGELNAKLGELLAAAGTPFDTTPTPDEATRIRIRRTLNSAKTVMSLLRDL